MKSWGIQARMSLLALGPATLIACLLVIYFSYSRIEDANLHLHDLGTAVAKNLADSAEFGVISGNNSLLQKQVSNVVKQGGVRFAMVVDTRKQVLARSGAIPAAFDMEQLVQGKSDQRYVFLAPIKLGEVDLSDLLTVEEANAAPKQLGWAVVAMSTAPLEQTKQQMLWTGLGIAFLGLVVTVLLAMRLGRSVSDPVRSLSQVVDSLGQGNLDARTAQDSSGELLSLQKGVNSMAEALQANQAELERKVLEATADLALKKEEAEESNRAKSNFLASVSHDLRQPMHAIGLFSATLKQRVTTLEQGELVQRIEDSVNALQNMFDGLLNISRIDAGMLEPNIEPCDLGALLKRIAQEFQPQAEEKGLQLRVHAGAAWVNSDVMLLGRMLGNLVSNAMRYTQQGGILMSCRAHKGQWLVQVWDTGIGMSEAHLPHIFEAYYQVGNPERNSARGVGLGLAIVAGIAKLLGYEVEVKSRPGRGSVFSVTLPRAKAVQVDRRTGAERMPGQFGGERVLIIEDDVAARNALQALLASWGLQVIGAESAEQIQAALEDFGAAPDLLICDYRLPGRTGVEVVADLRSMLGHEIPAIMVTGDTGAGAVEDMQSSNTPILFKPVRPAKLRALIASLLQGGAGVQ